MRRISGVDLATCFNSTQQFIYLRTREKYVATEVATTEQTFGSEEDENGRLNIYDKIALSINLLNSCYCYTISQSSKEIINVILVRKISTFD